MRELSCSIVIIPYCTLNSKVQPSWSNHEQSSVTYERGQEEYSRVHRCGGWHDLLFARIEGKTVWAVDAEIECTRRKDSWSILWSIFDYSPSWLLSDSSMGITFQILSLTKLLETQTPTAVDGILGHLTTCYTLIIPSGNLRLMRVCLIRELS